MKYLKVDTQKWGWTECKYGGSTNVQSLHVLKLATQNYCIFVRLHNVNFKRRRNSTHDTAVHQT